MNFRKPIEFLYTVPLMSCRSRILKRFMGNDVLAATVDVPHNFLTTYGWRRGFVGREGNMAGRQLHRLSSLRVAKEVTGRGTYRMANV
ncbi:hypothetical protein QFZ96_000282 [Paraburkholderia youngii]